MSEPTHQTGFIVTKLQDGSYAYTMTSVGVEFSAEQLQEMFDFFQVSGRLSPAEIDEAIAQDGQAVIGTPSKLTPQEELVSV